MASWTVASRRAVSKAQRSAVITVASALDPGRSRTHARPPVRKGSV